MIISVIVPMLTSYLEMPLIYMTAAGFFPESERGNVNSNKSDCAKRKYDIPEGKNPSIPGYILYKIKPDDIRKDLIRWRGI